MTFDITILRKFPYCTKGSSLIAIWLIFFKMTVILHLLPILHVNLKLSLTFGVTYPWHHYPIKAPILLYHCFSLITIELTSKKMIKFKSVSLFYKLTSNDLWVSVREFWHYYHTNLFPRDNQVHHHHWLLVKLLVRKKIPSQQYHHFIFILFHFILFHSFD